MGKDLEEIRDDLMELYTDWNDRVPPELYGALLGLHEKVDKLIKEVKNFPPDLQRKEQ